MFGVIYYTGAGKYKNVYQRIALKKIVVKFASVRQYCNCDYQMNECLKPFINGFINSQSNTILEVDEYDVDDATKLKCDDITEWKVDDVIARRSFFWWESHHDEKPHIDVSCVLFPESPSSWDTNDSMFFTFLKSLTTISKNTKKNHSQYLFEENKKKRKQTYNESYDN
jgi:hypothetical protein